MYECAVESSYGKWSKRNYSRHAATQQKSSQCNGESAAILNKICYDTADHQCSSPLPPTTGYCESQVKFTDNWQQMFEGTKKVQMTYYQEVLIWEQVK
ncbi:CLUMA_CG012271, isoform A [Clunio marinus]|uniref:CLUMA_CG012271, isoform A n=1 Tax=Clunio marinus TaxID=568069 RepID=A0A1J1IIU9_9DIPT|nr:CLUMA_CG012271, isoform A [Clunio marinus]